MPSARATPGTLCSVIAAQRTKPCVSLSRFFYLMYDFGDPFVLAFCCLNYFGDAFGPGYCGLAIARLLLRNEPSPAYPYRGFFYLKYDLGDAF